MMPFLRQLVLFLGVLAVACSSVTDEPYVVGGDDASGGAALSLADCEAQTFTTAPCVELLAEEAERKQAEQAAVLAAKANVNDLDRCYAFVVSETEEEATDEETTEATCEDVAASLLAGFDACTALAPSEKYYECVDIEDAVNATIELCDASSADVTTDFCALINPTTDNS